MSPAEAFWAFSLRFYAAPGVPALCLALQDAIGADVNVLLYLLFRAAGGVAFDAADIAGLEAAVRAWRAEVVQPLRAVRRALKAHETQSAAHKTLRTEVKKAELEAERLQQRLIAATAPQGRPGAEPAGAARASVAAYLRSIGAAPEAGDALIAAFVDHQA